MLYFYRWELLTSIGILGSNLQVIILRILLGIKKEHSKKFIILIDKDDYKVQISFVTNIALLMLRIVSKWSQ